MPRPPHRTFATPRAPRRVAAAAVFAACAGAAGAQAPSPWATVAIPGAASAPIVNVGKVVGVHDGTALAAFSAVTRRWHTFPSPGGGPLLACNDLLLQQQQQQWTAFASYTGTFAPLPVGAGAMLCNAAGATNDSLLVVADAGQLHVFSAFTGAWVSRPVPAGHLVAVQRHVAVLVAGTTISAFDAWTGHWHDRVVASAPTVVSADGAAGFAYGAGTVHAFSATRRAWTDAVEPSGATFARGDDWGIWLGPHGVLAYGATHGAFARGAQPATSVASTQDVFALLHGPAGVFAFSTLTNTVSAPIALPGATVSASGSAALLVDANGTRAYSAVHGRVAALANAGTQSGVANVVAWSDTASQGPLAFFSALTCQWHHAPPAVPPNAAVTLTTTSAACAVPGGLVAFSPRSGAFVPLADPGATPYGNPSSAPLLAIGPNALHGFDARLERWTSTAHVPVGPPSVQIWRTAAIVVDGTVALGFGAQAGSWSRTVLPGPVSSSRANSESARISTPNHVVAWSAIAEQAWFAQFPEFRRVQPAGSPMQLVVAVPAGGTALLGVGRLADAGLALGALGTLWLGPGGAAVTLLGSAPSGEPVRIAVAAPGTALLGVELVAQTAMVPAVGAPWLSDPARVMPR
jgi:hypothetical protein